MRIGTPLEPGSRSIPSRGRFLWAVLSAILLTLSFPRFSIDYLAWIALVPLLIALDGQRPWYAFQLGFVFGMVHYLGLVYWVTHAMHTYGQLSVVVSVAILFLLVAYLSLYGAVFACLTALTERRGFSLVIVAPLLWVGLEYIRSVLLTGFPWENISYTQYATLPIVQMSDITGSYGLSFYVVLVNSVLAHLVRGRQNVWDRKRTSRNAVLGLAAVSIVCWGYGFYRLQDVRAKEEAAPKAGVAVIQGNIAQDLKWNPAMQRNTIEVYEGLSRDAAKDFKPDMIIWPETAVPYYFCEPNPLNPSVRRLGTELGTNLLVGAPSYETSGHDQVRFHNSAYLLSSGGDVLGRYDKIHLVPFGEYVPARSLLPFADKLVAGVGDFTPGGRQDPLSVGQIRIGTLICFESIFPELARDQVLRGANLLAIITNDAWFGRSSAPYQHMSMAVFRAVENRVSLARAANTGVSMFVRPTGGITQKTAVFTRAFLRETLPIMSEQTVFSRWGDAFPKVCFIMSVVVVFLSIRRSRTHVC